VKLKKIFKSIAFSTSITITVAIAATTITVGELTLREQRKTFEIELQNKGRYLAEVMSHSLVDPLLSERSDVLLSSLQGFMKSEESIVVYAGIYDKNSESVVTAYKNEKYRTIVPPSLTSETLSVDLNITEDSDHDIYHFISQIKSETLGTIGFLRLVITKEYLNETLKGVRQKLYLLGAAIIFIGIMLALWMTRKILHPILTLNEGVKIVGEGELGFEVPVVGTGEINELALSFNKMSVKLKELMNTIKSAQENLIRTEKLYAVGEFSAGVAHEIKNPLTSIKMLLQVMEQKNQALTSKDMKVVVDEINRIDRIVMKFLAFARPAKAEKTELNINDVLEEVITITNPQMERSSINLVNNFSSDLPIIRGNNDTLKQAFLNIVLNAVQAMYDGGGTLSIETSAKNGGLSVITRDTGAGISGEDMKKIFNPFFTTKRDGTGMGLALTYNIIQDHSGKIDIDSTPGTGTTVTVELPFNS
jgi:signal transduction histidine kinase